MSKILISGGAGFLGSHLAEKLSLKHEVLVVDNFSTGSHSNLSHMTKSIEVLTFLLQSSHPHALTRCGFFVGAEQPAWVQSVE